ncbi:Adenosylcobinamide kinase [Budvicia aquatica]|uniref:Adenosylcobinamide kinase n=1 Tax=Budvicia aquatica TaxID=82979 RepID=A0A484ZJK0_9GAMM|nr:Adenosylcobinamide kinase [Budvicia aquatica]
MILVTGGARSGKSAFGEKLAKTRCEQVLYIATSVITDSGDGGQSRPP